MEGDPLTIFGSGGQTRDFVYAGDIANGIVHALTTEHANTAYNLSTQTETSLNDLITLFGKAVGHELHPVYQPARDWRPKVSLEEGLRRTVRFFSAIDV